MIKKHWKILAVTSIATLLPALVGLVLWHQLPAELPIHWNAQGEVDGVSSKTVAVLGMPLFLVAMQWVVTLAMLADPKRQNHSAKMLHLSLWLIPAVSIMVGAVTYATALGHEVRVGLILPLFLGLLFVYYFSEMCFVLSIFSTISIFSMFWHYITFFLFGRESRT